MTFGVTPSLFAKSCHIVIASTASALSNVAVLRSSEMSLPPLDSISDWVVQTSAELSMKMPNWSVLALTFIAASRTSSQVAGALPVSTPPRLEHVEVDVQHGLESE